MFLLAFFIWKWNMQNLNEFRGWRLQLWRDLPSIQWDAYFASRPNPLVKCLYSMQNRNLCPVELFWFFFSWECLRNRFYFAAILSPRRTGRASYQMIHHMFEGDFQLVFYRRMFYEFSTHIQVLEFKSFR